MTHLAIQDIENKQAKSKMPVLRPGYTVRVHQKIKEGEKERIQIFEGLVLGFNGGHGVSKMFTVRKIVEGIGVEKIFPLYSPVVAKIEVIKTSKVRRAKLFYMRNLAGKSTRLRSVVGLSAKDEKFNKKKSDLMEAMGANEPAPVVEESVVEEPTTIETPVVEATKE